MNAQVSLEDGSLSRVFVIANYIMDTLPTDAFGVRDGVLHFGTVRTKVRIFTRTTGSE